MTTINTAIQQGTDMDSIIDMLKANAADPKVAALMQTLTQGGGAAGAEPAAAVLPVVAPVSPLKPEQIKLAAAKPVIKTPLKLKTVSKKPLKLKLTAKAAAEAKPLAAAATPATADKKTDDIFGNPGESDEIVFASKQEKDEHTEKVRNEGLSLSPEDKTET